MVRKGESQQAHRGAGSGAKRHSPAAARWSGGGASPFKGAQTKVPHPCARPCPASPLREGGRGRGIPRGWGRDCSVLRNTLGDRPLHWSRGRGTASDGHKTVSGAARPPSCSFQGPQHTSGHIASFNPDPYPPRAPLPLHSPPGARGKDTLAIGQHRWHPSKGKNTTPTHTSLWQMGDIRPPPTPYPKTNTEGSSPAPAIRPLLFFDSPSCR